MKKLTLKMVRGEASRDEIRETLDSIFKAYEQGELDFGKIKYNGLKPLDPDNNEKDYELLADWCFCIVSKCVLCL